MTWADRSVWRQWFEAEGARSRIYYERHDGSCDFGITPPSYLARDDVETSVRAIRR